MATRFVHDDDHSYSCTLTGEEAELLANLLGQLVELLSDDRTERGETGGDADDELAQLVGIMGSTEPPDDPVLQRLLPSAYADDELAGEFRRYTEAGLRAAKVEGARDILTELGDASQSDRITVHLDPPAALSFLRTLTDLRLTLGTRLDVHDDDPDDRFSVLPDDDPTRWTHEVYLWLGWLQETLVDALDDGDGTHRGDAGDDD